MTELTTGQRIAQCRKSLALSQEGLGEKVGVSRQAISKWEADAAMPDIDKLITLNKLFSVSVGWLLGVEELPQAEEAPKISDELLHRLEELYRPRKKFPLWGKILIAAALILLLWSGIGLSREWHYMRHQVSHLAGQMQNNDNSAILSQLRQLENRIDRINDTIEREGAALADYEFQIHAEPDKDTAGIYLNAIPKTWNESWTATLSVRYDGIQTVSQTCAWDGSALIGTLKLKLLDGYECWLVIAYPDGSQEQIQLQDSIVSALKRSATIICDVQPGIWGWSSGRQIFTLEAYDLYLAQPTAMEESRWTRAEFILYHIRDGKRTVVATQTPMDESPESSTEFWADMSMEVTLPKLEPNDRLELWFEAELENGMRCSVSADSWLFQQGHLIWERFQ